jgi:outer membrane protein assembly factor BamA
MKAHREQGLRTIVAATLLIGAAWWPAQAQQESPPQQPGASAPGNDASAAETVAAVRIVAEDGRVLSEKPAGLPITVGKPLDRDQVAESIRALYRTGDYADVRAIATFVDGGVRIDFAVREQLFFNQVIIHGLVSPPTEASAIAAVQLPLGEPYRADVVNEGLERLRELLK